jgi:hypothetical protein
LTEIFLDRGLIYRIYGQICRVCRVYRGFIGDLMVVGICRNLSIEERGVRREKYFYF